MVWSIFLKSTIFKYGWSLPECSILILNDGNNLKKQPNILILSTIDNEIFYYIDTSGKFYNHFTIVNYGPSKANITLQYIATTVMNCASG